MEGKIKVFHLKTKPQFFEKEVLEKFMQKAIKKAGMTPYGKPIFIPYYIGCVEYGNVSWLGFWALKESFIAVDTWREYEYMNVTLNSCKKFYDKPIVDAITEVLQPYIVWEGLSEVYTNKPNEKIVYRREKWKRFLEMFNFRILRV